MLDWRVRKAVQCGLRARRPDGYSELPLETDFGRGYSNLNG